MQAFETPGDVTLQVRIPTGRVVVATADQPRTEIELVPVGRRGEDTIEQIEVSHDVRAGRHVVTIEQRDRIKWGPIQISWGGDVEVRVTCPLGTELEVSGASADFRADGSYGKVSARSASGDIRLGTVGGKLEAKTASGDVSVERIATELASIVTVSGDVEVGQADGILTVRTVSGEVELGVTQGPVTISTTSGDVDLKALEAGELRAQSVSGDVRIGVGRGTPIWVDASSVSGSMRSELEVGDAKPAAESDELGEVVPVHVKTVSGDVSIVRAAAAISH
jgi:DUF4097 and DUF4098 domain-containing protein YvlB